MTPFRKSQSIYLDDAEYEVLSADAGLTTHLENRLTGERIKVSTYNLLDRFVRGELRVMSNNIARRPGKFRASEQTGDAGKAEEHRRFSKLSDASQAETRRRIEYCVELERVSAFGSSHEKLKAEIARIAILRSEHRPPHLTTVYRWKRQFDRTGREIQALFARFDARGGKGKSRFHPRLEELLEQAIAETVYTQKRCSAELVQERLSVLVDSENLRRDDDEQLRAMALRTIQRRVRSLPAYDLDVARLGKAEADRRYAYKGCSRLTTRILELVEIDHTPLDLMIVDEKGIVLGRPVLTVALDRHSRCVLGYHLSSAGHGTPSVFAAVRHALLPKNYLETLYPNDGLEWPCFGWFERLLMDNGREFHAGSVKNALLALFIVAEFAASKSPNDKPFVERFFRTLNHGLIHTLPGTTLSKSHHRVGFNPEDEATLTLAQVDRILHVWICKKYHHRPHLGLDGQTPLEVWEKGAQAHPPQLKLNARDVEIELSESETLTVQQYGINLNGFVYNSVHLNAMKSARAKGLKVDVRWNKLNVGHIWIWDSAISDYVKVENKRKEFEGLTLDQAKAVIDRRRNKSSKYLKSGASAGETIRDIVNQGREAHKLLDRRRSARNANVRSAHSKETAIASEQRSDADIDTLSQGCEDNAIDESVAKTRACEDDLEVVIELPRDLQEH